MLMPKRVKRRRVHRGRMKGVATKGNKVTYGDYGLVADVYKRQAYGMKASAVAMECKRAVNPEMSRERLEQE